MEYVNTLMPALQHVSDYIVDKARTKSFSNLLKNSSEKIRQSTSLSDLNNALQDSTSAFYSDDFITIEDKAQLSSLTNEMGQMQLGVVQEEENKTQALGQFNALASANQNAKFDVGGNLLTNEEVVQHVRDNQSDPRLAFDLYRSLTESPATYTEQVIGSNGKFSLASALRTKSGQLFEQRSEIITKADDILFVDRNRSGSFDTGEALSPFATGRVQEINQADKALRNQARRSHRDLITRATKNVLFKDQTSGIVTMVTSPTPDGAGMTRFYQVINGANVDVTDRVDRAGFAGDTVEGKLSDEQKQIFGEFKTPQALNDIIELVKGTDEGFWTDEEITKQFANLAPGKREKRVSTIILAETFELLGGHAGLNPKFQGEFGLRIAHEKLGRLVPRPRRTSDPNAPQITPKGDPDAVPKILNELLPSGVNKNLTDPLIDSKKQTASDNITGLFIKK